MCRPPVPSDTSIGRLSASTMAAASRSASAGSAALSISTANSSPPVRAAVFSGPAASAIRRPTASSNWSPAACPSESLTSLKSSRSTNRTATVPCVFSAASAACSRRLWNSARLARPVRVSWNAWWARSLSSRRRSVTSRMVITRPSTAGSSRRSRQVHSTCSSRSSPEIAVRSTPSRGPWPVRTWSSSSRRSPWSVPAISRYSEVPTRSVRPNTGSADGLAYRIVSCSSTMRMTSDALWISALK